MASHSSATAREPHVNTSTQNNTPFNNAIKRRAESLRKDQSIDAQTRAVIHYCLKINDPWLAELVQRVDAGQSIVEIFPDTAETNNDDSVKQRIEALAEIICCGGGETAAALLVLMATLQTSTDPRAFANTVKHFAFTRCGELNFNGMVDANIPLLEAELLAAMLVV